MCLLLMVSALSVLPPVAWALGIVADLPNPCTTSDFHAPVYKISNFTLNIKDTRDVPQFQLTDTANQYSAQCNWIADASNSNWDPKPDEYSVLCDPKTLQGYPTASGWYDVKKNSLNVSQWWVCDLKNGAYPTRIEAFATIKFPKPLSCPNCTIAESRRASSCAAQRCSIADQDMPAGVATFKYPQKPTDPVRQIPPHPGEDQPSSVPDNDTPCISTSLSYPNWDVMDLDRASGSDGRVVTFTLTNHALDASIPCSAQSTGQVICLNGAATKTQGSFDVELGVLSIDQTWTCPVPGETRGTTFTASGRRVLSVDKTGIQTIRGTLSKPLTFKPNVYIPASQTANCRKLSEQGPSFQIKANTQQLSAGSFAVVGHFGDIVFDLTNNANGLSMHCEVKFAPELNNCTTITELKWFDCFPPDSGQFGREQGPITRFTYNVTSQEIVINQTWYCNEDETHPVKYTTVTKPAALPLRKRKSDTLFGWVYPTEDQRCQLPQLPPQNTVMYVYGEMDRPFTIPAVSKESISSIELPPYSISDRKPTGHSCTIASVLAPRLEIGELKFSASWSSIRPIANGLEYSGIYARARLEGIRSSVFPNTTWSAEAAGRTSLVPRTEKTNYSEWYSCPQFYNSAMTGCMWTIDFEGGYMAINQTWVCNDKDLTNPIMFQSSSSMTFNKNCSYSYDSGINCKIELASNTLYPTYITNNATG